MFERSEPDAELSILQLEPGTAAPVQRWKFPVGQTIQIGRQPENDIVLKHPKVSRFHASVFHDGQNWHCACFGSNGVFVDGESVSQVQLKNGSLLEFARSGPRLLFEFQESEENEARGSMTFLIDQLNEGRPMSAIELWSRCLATIVRLARQKLGAAVGTVDEDLADSVFESLFFGSARQKLPKINDREGLWQLIVAMVQQKADTHAVGEPPAPVPLVGDTRPPRSRLDQASDPTAANPEDMAFLSAAPSDESLAAIEEQTRRWLKLLPDDNYRRLALLRLEGFSDAEIAQQLSWSVKDVERRLKRVREIWSQQLAPETAQKPSKKRAKDE